jgi:upstream activation factor subunit UAF30
MFSEWQETQNRVRAESGGVNPPCHPPTSAGFAALGSVVLLCRLMGSYSTAVLSMQPGGITMATAKKAAKKPAKKAVKKPAAKKAAKKPAAKKAAKKPAAKKAAPKKKVPRKPNAAFMKPVMPSAALAAVIGDKPAPRTEVTSKIWAYIKKNGLQDKVNRRNINADDKLKVVFGGKKTVSMFEMTKLVSAHLK